MSPLRALGMAVALLVALTAGDEVCGIDDGGVGCYANLLQSSFEMNDEPRFPKIQVPRVRNESELALPWKNRKPIVWVHLHKFAGTFMCMESIRQGERPPGTPSQVSKTDISPLVVARGINNCNFPGDGQNPTDSVYCKARAASPYTFMALERHVVDLDFCDDALFGTILRDPLLGAVSTQKFEGFDKPTLLRILRTGKVERCQSTRNTNRGSWDNYQHFDNFATRTLGGGYDAPPRQVTAAHLELAKRRLQRMDVLVILEEFQDHLPQLSSVFGWDVSKIDIGKKANKGENVMFASDEFTTEEKDFLATINRFDYELYEYGSLLAANRTASAGKVA